MEKINKHSEVSWDPLQMGNSKPVLERNEGGLLRVRCHNKVQGFEQAGLWRQRLRYNTISGIMNS